MGDAGRQTVKALTAGRRRIEQQTMPRDWQVMAGAYLPVLLYAVLRTPGRAADWPGRHRHDVTG